MENYILRPSGQIISPQFHAGILNACIGLLGDPNTPGSLKQAKLGLGHTSN